MILVSLPKTRLYLLQAVDLTARFVHVGLLLFRQLCMLGMMQQLNDLNVRGCTGNGTADTALLSRKPMLENALDVIIFMPILVARTVDVYTMYGLSEAMTAMLLGVGSLSAL